MKKVKKLFWNDAVVAIGVLISSVAIISTLFCGALYVAMLVVTSLGLDAIIAWLIGLFIGALLIFTVYSIFAVAIVGIWMGIKNLIRKVAKQK